MRISCALALVRFLDDKLLDKKDFSKALFPLLKMLRDGKSDKEKIAAALALHKIENEIGIYRLKIASKFDDSRRVRYICLNLYYDYHKKNNTLFLAYLN